MIKYALKCANDHSFDSWFASADAYDSLHAAGHVGCAICGSTDVSKAIMAPRVSHGTQDAPEDTPALCRAAQDPAEAALSEIRDYVEKNATYVGGGFAKEARAQHLGDMPDRPIWGEARPAEAKSLIDDGVPIAPLPFVPSRKAN